MMVNEVNNDETKVPDEFVFRSVSLVYFTAELDELTIKTSAAYSHAKEQLCLCSNVLVLYFVVLDIHL